MNATDLARELDCSAITIRRDLTLLERQGLLVRSRGGATAARKVFLEFSMEAKARVHRAEKQAIGRAAAQLVKPGERVILDTGTTTLAMAEHLRGQKGVSVVTTSLAIVTALISAPGIDVLVAGGQVRDSSPDLFGPLVEENLSRIHADWAFVGCDGLSVSGGLTTHDARVARATSLMIAGAARAALVADSSKAGKDAFIRFAELRELDWLITDSGMPAEVLDAARAAGVETVVVDPEA